MRYRITVQYNGAAYSGWQSQENARSVQSVVEKAMAEVLGHEVRVFGCGRTDRGVHAEMQVCHFDTPKRLHVSTFPMGVNLRLPPDVALTDCRLVAEAFDARFDATKKRYVYRAYISPYRHPLLDGRFAQFYKMPDVEKMRQAAKYFLGEHDFASFMASGSQTKNTVRELYRFDLVRNGEELLFLVEGNGFLYHMVRILVGTLLEVGYGKRAPEEMPALLQARCRKKSGKTAPACGLCLQHVWYAGEDLSPQ